MSSNSLFKSDNNCKSDEELFKSRFKRLCDSDINCDCEFIVGCDKVVIKGHKLIFSLGSQVFYDMFHKNLEENSVVVIDDLEPVGFKKMKQFIYTGEIDFEANDELVLTYLAGKKYNTPLLFSKCIRYIEEKINSHPSYAINFYNSFGQDNIKEFNEICCKAIQKQSKNIFNSEESLSARPETLDWILSFESLPLSSELDLFNFFERWAHAEIKRRNIAADQMVSSFNNLRKHIRFLTLNAKEFASIATKSSLLTEKEKVAVALNLMEFGSMPFPDSLSSNKKKRNSSGNQQVVQSMYILNPHLPAIPMHGIIPHNLSNSCNQLNQRINYSTVSSKPFLPHLGSSNPCHSFVGQPHQIMPMTYQTIQSIQKMSTQNYCRNCKKLLN